MTDQPKTFDSPPGDYIAGKGLFSIYQEPRDEIDVFVLYFETMGTWVYAYEYLSEYTTLDAARADMEIKRREFLQGKAE